jgi:hypothetical protein
MCTKVKKITGKHFTLIQSDTQTLEWLSYLLPDKLFVRFIDSIFMNNINVDWGRWRFVSWYYFIIVIVGQTIQWPREKEQKDKEWSILRNTTQKTKDCNRYSVTVN